MTAGAVAPPTPDLDGSLDELEARSAVRRVMASYIDACDVEKDPELIADHFTPDGIWQGVGKGEEFGRNVGRAAIVEMFTVNPSRQPWTVHYLTSERIDVDGATARGRWQCLESSVIRHGRQGVWMGVTYDNDFVLTADGWRLAHIRCGEEFISPYEDGWQRNSDMAVIDDTTDGPGIPDSLVHRGFGDHDSVPGHTPIGDIEQRLDALESERAVGALMSAHLRSLDRGAGGAAASMHFAPEARWIGLGAYARFGERHGVDAIADVLDAQHLRFPQQSHHLANDWVEATNDRAIGRWICLAPSTAADGSAWWVASRFRVEFVATSAGWRIAELRVRDIVTAPYLGGWLAAGDPAGAT